MPGLAVHHQLLELTQTHAIELVMPSNHLILCRPLLFLPSIFPRIRVFSNESVLPFRWPKYWSFSFSISPSNEYSGLISFRMDWLDLLAVQGTLKSLLQHHSSKASILHHSAFSVVQLSHTYITAGKTVVLTRWTSIGKVMSLRFNMLSSLVIAFLSEQASFNFVAVVTICSDFGAQENKVCTVSIVSPTICHEVMEPDAMILVFWMLIKNSGVEQIESDSCYSSSMRCIDKAFSSWGQQLYNSINYYFVITARLEVCI